MAPPGTKDGLAVNELLPSLHTSRIVPYRPSESRTIQAKADAVIAYGVKIRDWPLVEEAIAAKIEDQLEFLSWWDTNVRVDGRPKTCADLSTLSPLLTLDQAETLTKISHQQVSRWRKALKNQEAYRQKLLDAAYKKAGLIDGDDPDNPHITRTTGEHEWYTPVEIIALARSVLGEIDLDPASSEIAQKNVQALAYYTKHENGLSHPWCGKVWLNPPYSEIISDFVGKLIEHVQDGSVSAAIMLVDNRTDTQWFHYAAAACSRLCFTRGRLKFLRPDETPGSPLNGSAFFYFGNDADLFTSRFSNQGIVLKTPDR